MNKPLRSVLCYITVLAFAALAACAVEPTTLPRGDGSNNDNNGLNNNEDAGADVAIQGDGGSEQSTTSYAACVATCNSEECQPDDLDQCLDLCFYEDAEDPCEGSADGAASACDHVCNVAQECGVDRNVCIEDCVDRGIANIGDVVGRSEECLRTWAVLRQTQPEACAIFDGSNPLCDEVYSPSCVRYCSMTFHFCGDNPTDCVARCQEWVSEGKDACRAAEVERLSEDDLCDEAIDGFSETCGS